MAKRRSAFTLVELAAVVCVGTAAAGIVAVGLQPATGGAGAGKTAGEGAAGAEPTPAEISAARAQARQLKDATNVRGLMQAMIMWAANNGGKFPLPSEIDKGDDTVSLNGRAKDTTANILSLMIYNGMVSPEMCVSAAEASANIKVDDRYEFTNPRAAMRPGSALWDPGFRADFTKDQMAFNSFAYLQPSDGRLDRWADTFITVEPVVANRGPEIVSVERAGTEDGGWSYTAKAANEDSLTYLIHGPRTSWEGNVAYADGHVEFLTRIAPEGKVEDKKWLAYTTREDKKFLDTYFFDEPDDKAGSNAFLGIFVTAGRSPKDYRAIWD